MQEESKHPQIMTFEEFLESWKLGENVMAHAAMVRVARAAWDAATTSALAQKAEETQ